MAINRVQEKSATAALPGSTASVTFGIASTAGNLLIAVVLVPGTGTTIGTPSGFTAGPTISNVNGPNLSSFYFANSTSKTTISSALSGTADWGMFIAEYSGINTTMPLDQINTATTVTGSAPVSGSVTLSQTNELIVAALGTIGTNSYASATGGFSLVDTFATAGTVNAGAYLDLFPTSATGAFSTSANTTTGGNGLIFSFTSPAPPLSPLNAIWTGSVF